jgi:hypothetical protein
VGFRKDAILVANDCHFHAQPKIHVSLSKSSNETKIPTNNLIGAVVHHNRDPQLELQLLPPLPKQLSTLLLFLIPPFPFGSHPETPPSTFTLEFHSAFMYFG